MATLIIPKYDISDLVAPSIDSPNPLRVQHLHHLELIKPSRLIHEEFSPYAHLFPSREQCLRLMEDHQNHLAYAALTKSSTQSTSYTSIFPHHEQCLALLAHQRAD